MKRFLFTLTSVLFVFNFAKALQMSDVSILYPLPKLDDQDQLISHQNANNILPKKVFNLIPFFINQANEDVYPLMKVVGVRIDPCFQEGLAPVACKKQVRFIWQPVQKVNDHLETIDASLHVFFNLTDKAFAYLIQSLKELNERFPMDNQETYLWINPRLEKWGLNSEYAKSLRKILLTAVYKKEISRITFMKLKGDNDFWVFGGFDFIEGKAQAIKIPNTDVTEQEFINEFARRENPKEFQGGIFPEPDKGVNFNVLVQDSMLSPSITEDEILAMIKGSADIDNPLKNNPGTVDCVSCHISNMVKEWLFLNIENKSLVGEYRGLAYSNSKFNLENHSANFHVTNSLRMFGYFKDQPMISQRTINESAEVLNNSSL